MLVSGSAKVYEQPKGGLYEGVLADVIDLGLVEGMYGVKPRTRLIWFLNAADSEGNFFRVQKSYNAVLHEKSNLYADVRDMLGAAPSIPYELDNLIGKNFQLVIVPATKKDGTPCVNVKAILSPKPGQSFQIPADFVRNKDRKAQTQSNPAVRPATVASAKPAASAPVAPPVEAADEEIPF
jgi:hypothetical protein